MAILSMFYSVVIPIENLKKIFTKRELYKVLTKRSHNNLIWFDDYLYREGSMSPGDNEAIIKFWEECGLVIFDTKDGKEHWKDLCLVSALDNETTTPCDWIEFFYNNEMYSSCYFNLKGKPRELLIENSTPIEKFFEKLYPKK